MPVRCSRSFSATRRSRTSSPFSGMDELSEEDKLTVARARKIERFMSQPFYGRRSVHRLAGQARVARRHHQGLQAASATATTTTCRNRRSTWSARSTRRSKRQEALGRNGSADAHLPLSPDWIVGACCPASALGAFAQNSVCHWTQCLQEALANIHSRIRWQRCAPAASCACIIAAGRCSGLEYRTTA